MTLSIGIILVVATLIIIGTVFAVSFFLDVKGEK